MNRRPLYEVADPHPDYHDQGIPPRHEETRPLRDASKRTQETGPNTQHNTRSPK